MKQRLAAILAADAVGYSRLMSGDERATVDALDAARGVFSAHVAANEGRIIDTAGDSVLALFDTAAGAVRAALAVQEELETQARSLPEDRRMRFRIGVHLGDVIEKPDGTIYGDGVNIAARLQTMAKPGAVVVSEPVHSAVRGRVAAGFADLGEQRVKNFPHPVRAFSVLPGDAAAEPAPSEQPSVAVLPFGVLSDDKKLEYVADALAEDVIALLARVPGFLVISPASSFVFRNAELGVPDVARQLGVRYVVEGSLRAAGPSVRIATQLTDAASGRVLWSGRFEARRGDAVDLQDDIALGILSELEPQLTRAEITLIRRQRPENVDAWGCYRQGVAALALKGWSEEAISEALGYFKRAIAIDARFGLAHANYALTALLAKTMGLGPAFAALEHEAIAAAEKAIELDDGSSQVLGYAGCAIADAGQPARAIEILERALELDPSNAQAHVALGAALAVSKRLDDGIARMRQGMRISPKDRRLGFWGWALAGFLLRAGRSEEALQEGRLAIRRDPRFYQPRILEAAALLMLQRPDEASIALKAARQARPALTLEEIAVSHGRRIAQSLAPLFTD